MPFKKFVLIFTFLAFSIWLFGSNIPVAKALKFEDISAQIASIQAQIGNLQLQLALLQKAQRTPSAPEAVEDEILVKFKPGITNDTKENIKNMFGLTTKEKIDLIGVEVLKVSAKAKDKVIASLIKNKAIEFAEPNYIVQTLDTIPNDPAFRYGQGAVKQIRCPSAWDITTGSSSVVIAIVDTGIDATHYDLSAKVLPGYNFVANNTNTADDNGHGTRVAGVAAAITNNGVGMAGVSWQSPLMPIKVCDANGGCSVSNVARGITWASDKGAKVINISLGGAFPCGSTFQSAADYAWNKGAVLVAAAGNDGSAVNAPANCNNVIAAGATDENDVRTSWSSHGSALDVVAPGIGVDCTTPNNGISACSGTSFSSPLTAGTAALIFAAGAGSNSAVVTALTKGADDFGDPGWDPYYGWGRVNAYKAVQYTSSPPPPDTTIPTVSITSPTSGSTISGSITVSINASDNVGVTKVELYIDGALFGIDTTSPYSFFWDTTTVSDGSHTLVAKAYDAAGNIGTSPTVTVTVSNPPVPDTTPPSISVSSPSDGATVWGTITISANATDNVAVASVSFFVDGVFIGEDTKPPYSINWDTTTVANGAHTISATAIDTSNNIGKSAVVTVIVNNLAPDTTPPSVSITYPVDGGTVVRNTAIIITATATDNVGVAKVEFLVNNRLKCTDITSPYTCSWNVPAKRGVTYTLTAKAYDAAGNTASHNIRVTSADRLGLEDIESQLASITQVFSQIAERIKELIRR